MVIRARTSTGAFASTRFRREHRGPPVQPVGQDGGRDQHPRAGRPLVGDERVNGHRPRYRAPLLTMNGFCSPPRLARSSRYSDTPAIATPLGAGLRRVVGRAEDHNHRAVLRIAR